MGLDKFLTVYMFIQLVKACKNFDEFCRVWLLNDDIKFKSEVFNELSKEEQEKYKPWFSEAKRIYYQCGNF